jgi:hypothetical protein
MELQLAVNFRKRLEFQATLIERIMNVNNCQIVSVPDDANKEGFSSTVRRGDILRGPFNTINEAIRCAQSWDQTESQPVPESPPVTIQPETEQHD